MDTFYYIVDLTILAIYKFFTLPLTIAMYISSKIKYKTNESIFYTWLLIGFIIYLYILFTSKIYFSIIFLFVYYIIYGLLDGIKYLDIVISMIWYYIIILITIISLFVKYII